MEKKEFLDILNLDEKASIKDIKSAYILLKNLYSENNIITESLENEFLTESRSEIIEDIDEAYKQLMLIMQDTKQTSSDIGNNSSDNQPDKPTGIEQYDGQTLKLIREANNIDLEEISLATNIKRQYLLNLENEDFNDMPPKVFIKGYLRELSKYLNVDEVKVTEYYLQKYDEWKAAQ